MADTSNVQFTYEPAPLDVVAVDVASTTVLAKGDLVKLTTGKAVAVTAAGDNGTFLGVCMNNSRNGETSKILVAIRGRAKITVSSTTYTIGNSLKYSAGANGTDWVLAKATSGADGLMWSVEYAASAVTTLEVQWDTTQVGGFSGGAGLFEKHAA